MKMSKAVFWLLVVAMVCYTITSLEFSVSWPVDEEDETPTIECATTT